jgi:pimeloyl-ACP methyl ester carboxylesterase
MTFLAGTGDTVVRSIWTDRETNWYNNYTIEYVPDGGHFLMMEKPEIVVDRIRRMKTQDGKILGAPAGALWGVVNKAPRSFPR